MRTATAQDIVKRLTGTPYAKTAENALGGGMGPAQLGITEAVDAAVLAGLVKVVDVRDTTYARGVRFLALVEPPPAPKALTAVVDDYAPDSGTVYGAVAGERVGVRLGDRSLTEAIDARIVAEGYVRVGDWTRLGPARFTATIEAHPQRCETCVKGCDCEAGKLGCEHAHCWGVVGDEVHNSCPGIAAIKL